MSEDINKDELNEEVQEYIKHTTDYIDKIVQFKLAGGNLDWNTWMMLTETERDCWVRAEAISLKDKLVVKISAERNPYFIEEVFSEVDEGLSLRERVIEEELNSFIYKERQNNFINNSLQRKEEYSKEKTKLSKEFEKVILRNVKDNLPK